MLLSKNIYTLFLCILLSAKGCITVADFDKGKLIANSDAIVEMPFQLENGLIVIEAEVNGIKGKFLFDNGFSLSAVNQQFAGKAGIQFKSKSRLTDANSRSVTIPLATVDMVRLGHLDFVQTGFYQINTNLFFPCTPIDGIIGASIINKANWEIDFGQKILRVSSQVFNNSGIKLNVSFNDNNTSFTTFLINGDSPVKCKIDFGKNSALSLRYDDVISFMKGTPVEKFTGARALSAHGLGQTETFYITASPFQIKHKDNQLPSSRATITQNQKYSGYVGIEYFKDFLVTINSTEKKYILSDTSVKENNETENLSYGLSIYFQEEKWIIIQKNETDSLLTGINLYDEVSEIDNTPMTSFSTICEFKSYMEEKKQKKEPLILKTNSISKPLILPYKTPVFTTLH